MNAIPSVLISFTSAPSVALPRWVDYGVGRVREQEAASQRHTIGS
jgi:hypothetical protein